MKRLLFILCVWWIGYLNPGKYIGDFTTIFESFKDTEGLIVDMRYYPNKNILDIPYRYIDNTDREFAKCIKCDGFFPGLAFMEMVTTGEYAEYENVSTYRVK